ncbi:MAG: Glycosyl transferase family protein [Parcubacteria group bacterium GW2011_GWA1_50_14]|nr:MAG: Glycosyl transferase family protein [Parcubacteria group bacterium GW2011_GWA1_50_14]
MTNKPFLSVVIPAYNEAERIPLTLIDIDKHLSQAKYSYEIIVVDDGSTDDTAAVVERFTKMIPGLRVTGYGENRGKGGAVKFGMLEAQGRYRLLTDADNSTSIDHFDKMIPHFENGFDVVICSRADKESKLTPPQGLLRQMLGKGGNLIIQALVLPGIWDTQCGFKCFTSDSAEKVFPLQKIAGWGFDVEILSLAKRLGFKIKQIPVVWVNDTESHVGASAYIKTLIETLRIRIWLWRDVYSIKAK